MKSTTVFFLITIIVFLSFSGGCTSTKDGKSLSYYVSNTGNDDNPGTQKRPFRSIDRINGLDLNPGDAVFFAGGQVFGGTLLLDSLDSGRGEQLVLISSYGDGRAVLDGGSGSALRADGCNYLSLQNLVLCGAGRKEGNTGDGVHISHGDHILVDNLEASGFQHSGLRLHTCDNLIISNVYAHDNGFAGIYVSGNTENDPLNYDNQDLYIGYCVAENNPGDPTELNKGSGFGIIAHSVERGVIEYCEAFNNGWDIPWNGGPGPRGISVWDSRDLIVQHCIAHDNRTIPGGHDGGGFVFDGGTSHSVIQYCISFRNGGAGFGLFEHGGAKPWRNNIIRFNISQDDGIVNHYASLGIWKIEDLGEMSSCEIYNNTFYNSNPGGSALWIWEDYPGFNFRNNVFIYEGSFIWEGRELATTEFHGNCYWNLGGKQEIQGYSSLEAWARATGNEILDETLTGVFADPLLVDPGTLNAADPEGINAENLSPYMLRPGSPLIDMGLNLKQLFGVDPGKTDLLGNALPIGEAFDIGALEYINE